MNRLPTIAKGILLGILMVGAVVVAASSPYFAFYGSKQLQRILAKRLNQKKVPDKNDPRFRNAFYYLKRKGYLKIQEKNHQIYISLTEKGKRKAKKYQIDDLKVEKQKRWDGKYRIVIFDIPQITRSKRDAFRGKLKELGFYRLQHSAWICPYPCEKEIKLLQEFFGLDNKELVLVESTIKYDQKIRQFFKI